MAQWEFSLCEAYDNNLRFSNSEIQEIHFHAFYSLTSLLLCRIISNDIVLIFFLGYFIVLYLCFYILG